MITFLDCDNIETVVSEVSDERLDVFVSNAFTLTRSRSAMLIGDGLVMVNGVQRKKNYSVALGDVIEVAMPTPVEVDVVKENIPLNIVYEDSDLLVVNKEQGMVVHPAPGHYSGTLVNALLYHISDLSGINGALRSGIVHRIDKNTSGLLLVAKNDLAHFSLSEQIKEHSLDRFYEAVVHGTPHLLEGDVDYSIGRSKTDRKKMAAYPPNCSDAGVRKAFTHYEVIESYKSFSHLRLKLKTGRTHQIRVHMKAIGHPVVGDDVYAPSKLETFGLSGQCLHAKAIGFTHPRTGERLYFESELPDYFTGVIKKLELK